MGPVAAAPTSSAPRSAAPPVSDERRAKLAEDYAALMADAPAASIGKPTDADLQLRQAHAQRVRAWREGLSDPEAKVVQKLKKRWGRG